MVWLKSIGGMWMTVGAAGLLWGVVALLPVRLPPAVQRVSEGLRLSPWAAIAGIALGLFYIVLGQGLVRQQSWSQMVMLPAHLLVILYVIVEWIAACVLRGYLEVWWAGAPALFLVLIVLNGGSAFLLSTVSAKEALSWIPMQTLPDIPLQCETCGSPLDPETQMCPQCDIVLELARGHPDVVLPKARLVGLSDDSEYWIQSGETVSIGRGLSGNDINLSNPTVSRHHAQIAFSDGHFVLTALQDTNGTFVNDTLIRQRPLGDGDEVRLGRARFQFAIVEN
ncbi:MAG: FHA domain-containing protein [Anaerolineae bacterium]|nr:FHA domain-containing protein [Anaerolineae bacterium]